MNFNVLCYDYELNKVVDAQVHSFADAVNIASMAIYYTTDVIDAETGEVLITYLDNKIAYFVGKL